MSMPVTLIVKAPNQQIEDQTIKCELDWSIKRLKGYLSEVYPSKPKTEDQKLIYLGQLLNDANTLKDVLRTYDEGQENHTVHLVCAPPKDSFKSSKPVTKPNQRTRETTNTSTTSSPGEVPTEPSGANVRQRQHATTSTPGPNIQTPVGFNMIDPRRNMANPANMRDLNNYAFVVTQQAAVMQQMYAQYMTQYFQMNGMSPPNFQYPGMMYPFQVPNGAQQPVRNEPVIPAPQPADGEEEGGQNNRDWLEWLYKSSRLMILFCIVYYYSSPLRLFLVSTLGLLLYLYQIGFFRQIVLENNNEPGVAPPPDPPADGDRSEESPAEVRPPRPTLLTMTWTIVSSFFLSLIPEHPNML